jgi:hypothetical protein
VPISKTKHDFSRLEAYAIPTKRGGIDLDVEGLAIDFVVALKVGGCSRAEFLDKITDLWDTIEVTLEPEGPKGPKGQPKPKEPTQ